MGAVVASLLMLLIITAVAYAVLVLKDVMWLLVRMLTGAREDQSETKENGG